MAGSSNAPAPTDAEVQRRQLEEGTYWASTRHLLAFMSGQKGSSSVLCWLPSELLTKIARLAIRQNSRLVWAPLPDSPDLDVGYWRGGTTIALLPGPTRDAAPSLWLPRRRQVYYLELALDDLWCGSGISCHRACLEFTTKAIVERLVRSGCRARLQTPCGCSRRPQHCIGPPRLAEGPPRSPRRLRATQILRPKRSHAHHARPTNRRKTSWARMRRAQMMNPS